MDSMLGKVDPATLSSVSKLTKEQSELLQKLTGILSGQVGAGAEPYSGTLTAGASPLQKQSWDAISDLISGGTQQDSSKQAIEKLLSGTTNVPGAVDVKGYDVGEFDPAAIQDWYQNALVKPAMDTWEKNVAPAVQEKFISQNAGSSGAANRAISGSAADLMTQLNAQLADKLQTEKGAFDTRKFGAGMDTANKEFASETDFVNRLFGAGQNDLGRLTTVPGLENQSMDAFFKALGLGTDAGATQQGVDQNALIEEYTKWQQSQPYNNPWLKLLESSMGTSASEPVVTGGSSQEGWLKPATEIAKIIGSWS